MFPTLFRSYSFRQLDIHSYLQSSLARLGFDRMTPVQAQAFVSLSNMRDVVLASETGSGKTLAYLLPIFNNVLMKASGSGLVGRPPAVIVLPSVELCAQVLSVAVSLDTENRVSKQFLTGTNFKLNGSIIEAPRIRWGMVDLVVATPAMLASDIARFRADKLMPSCAVFDEADLLFHAHPNMLEILRYLRPSLSCQCVFSSATLPAIGPFTIGNMIAQRFGTAEMIRSDHFHSVPPNIETEWIPELEAHWETRCFLLAQSLPPNKRVLVFTNSKTNCKLVYEFLFEKKWPVQMYSRQTAAKHVGIESNVWVCTDLAARGLDWPDIDLVINFQMPNDVVSWLHRAGRTGRMGKSGKVISFFKKSEIPIVDLLRTGGSISNLFSHKRSLRRKMVVSVS